MKKIFGVLLILAVHFSLACEAKEYWIAPRKDGKPGSGKRSDPRNAATTAQFDQFFQQLKKGDTVHLLPGTYTTMGNAAFRLPSNVQVFGSGMDSTIVKLEKYGGIAPGCVFRTDSERDQGNQVADMTVDCNYQKSWGAVTIGAVALFGDGHTISNVHCKGASGFAQESFPLAIACHTRNSAGNVIQNCKVSHYAGGWCTAIFIANNSTLHNSENPPRVCHTRAIVRNNAVFLNSEPGGKGNECAYGAGGVNNTVIKNNYSYGATYGFTYDTGRIKNLTIRDNIFEACSYTGINARAARSGDCIDGLFVTRNTISISAPKGVSYAMAIGGDHASPARNVHIDSNTIYKADSTSESGNIRAIRVFGIDGLDIRNNRIQEGLFSQLLEGLHSTGMSGNTDLSGRIPTADLNPSRQPGH